MVFCDLRGFTAFADTAEPEEVMAILHQYHTAMGELIFCFEGTLERFTGDGLMVFFNDPVPCPDPAARASPLSSALLTRSTTSTMLPNTGLCTGDPPSVVCLTAMAGHRVW